MQTHTQPPPMPAHRHIVLESAGIKPSTFTPHTFVESRLAPDPEVGWLHPQWNMYFVCDKTKVERQYGVVDATGITAELQSTEDGIL